MDPVIVRRHRNRNPEPLGKRQTDTLMPQVEDSDDQISKEPAGKRRKKRWILQEYTGSHRNMKAVFRPENFRIFLVISDQFLA